MESIYAIDCNNGLSKKGVIPWKSKKDILFFMNKTKHNVVIMGKNTFFSIPEEHRPLLNRLNIVLTRDPQLYHTNKYQNVLFTSNDSIHNDILNNKKKYYEKYDFLHKDFTIFFIGGKTIYNKFIPLCNKIWVTKLKGDYNCDLFIDYDFSKQFEEKLYEENDELLILEYTSK